MSLFFSESIRKTPKVVCHVFESEEASFIAQSIGQAFQVAYVEFLRANGIDDPAYLREIDYQVRGLKRAISWPQFLLILSKNERFLALKLGYF